ncbi:hypothetical protein MF271_19945 (plasmid) [Deinococcus sp. KNUC1210]|uniref:hypothetical protein n=1 Tax=Deinococcus sp. KNUC1210 TaxID=2917691 RepID=UPI001EF10ED9|nr:hypothetical protein [Deinococcus sp. KNUC1210]ULH17687.1 hypothetical protein MF271_19945 [Deinococcus sp. KNUC1210]
MSVQLSRAICSSRWSESTDLLPGEKRSLPVDTTASALNFMPDCFMPLASRQHTCKAGAQLTPTMRRDTVETLAALSGQLRGRPVGGVAGARPLLGP